MSIATEFLINMYMIIQEFAKAAKFYWYLIRHPSFAENSVILYFLPLIAWKSINSIDLPIFSV